MNQKEEAVPAKENNQYNISLDEISIEHKDTEEEYKEVYENNRDNYEGSEILE